MYAGSPKHPIFSGSTFGLMSGEKPLYQPQVEGGHEALAGALQQMGLQYEETAGKYKEPERSYIIHNPTLDQMKQLGKMFGQESVVHSQHGQHRLHYTNGEHEGKFHAAEHQTPIEHFEQPPPDFYTAVPGHGYTRINFDWNQMHEGHDKPQPLAASEKEYTPDQAAAWLKTETAKLMKALPPQVPYETQVAMDGLQEQGYRLGEVPQSPGVYGMASDRAKLANMGQTANLTTANMQPGVDAHYENLVDSGMNPGVSYGRYGTDALNQVADRQFWNGVGTAGFSRDPADPNYARDAHYANHPGQLAADKLGPDLHREAGLYDNAPKPPALTSTLGAVPSSDSMKASWRLSPSHPHAYDWHDGHSVHHEQDLAGAQLPGLMKADPAHGTNEQAAGVGVSTYKQFALPYGQVNPGSNPNLLHYPYQGKLPEIEKLVHDHGFKTYYAGGKYGKPDLANKNYNTGHLMVYDPTPSSGANFGEEEYTKGWRQIHELAHALTYPELNKIYGEGRRIGKLGTHRTMNEALRAVHWEWLAGHKQRELSKQIGVNLKDEDFHRELNTVMHDAAHRAVTGKFTEPSGEGFTPHGRKVPLHTALQLVRDSGHQMGLTGLHDTIGKKPGLMKAELAKANPPQAESLVTADALQEQGFKPTPGYTNKQGLGTDRNTIRSRSPIMRDIAFDNRQGKPQEPEGSLPNRQPTGESREDFIGNVAANGAPLTAQAIREASQSAIEGAPLVPGLLSWGQSPLPSRSYRPVSYPGEPGAAHRAIWTGDKYDKRAADHYWENVGVERPDVAPGGIPTPDRQYAKTSKTLSELRFQAQQAVARAAREPTAKSELQKADPIQLQSPAAAGVTRAPAPLHTTVEGFMSGLKALPKGDPSRGKFITSHMNHGPFLSALSAHPQGKQIHAMLTTHLNSKANAGPTNAVATVKSELAKAWPKDEKENQANAAGFLDSPVGRDQAMEQTGVNFKAPVVHGSKNPASKLPNIPGHEPVMPEFMSTGGGASAGRVYAKTSPAQLRARASKISANLTEKYKTPIDLSVQGDVSPHEVEEATSPEGTYDPSVIFPHINDDAGNPSVEMQAGPTTTHATNQYWGDVQREMDGQRNDHWPPGETLKSEPIFTKNEGDHTVADEKMYSRDEAVQILLKATKERVETFEKGIKNLRERELKKAMIAPHKHNQGMQAGSAAEDVPPGKMNPKGIDKGHVEKNALMGEGGVPAVTVKAELCKKCGKGHEMSKACGELEKADLVAENGKRTDNHTVKGSKLPDDAKSKVIEAKGSGGKIKLPGSNLKKNIVGGPQIMGNMLSPGGSNLAKVAAPPMAKPPSGKNMGTAVPVSAPKAPSMKPPAAPAMKSDPMEKQVDKLIVHGSKPVKPPKDADYDAKKDGKDAVYEAKGKKPSDLEKGIISPGVKQQMSTHMLADASKQAAPAPAAAPVKLPTPAQHAERAAGFAAAMPGPTFQPQPKPGLASPKAAGVTRATSPVMNAAKPQASRPGIFGKLFGKAEISPDKPAPNWKVKKEELDKSGKASAREPKTQSKPEPKNPYYSSDKTRTNFNRKPRLGSRPRPDPDDKPQNSWANSVVPGAKK